jgi:hypothetical protein
VIIAILIVYLVLLFILVKLRDRPLQFVLEDLARDRLCAAAVRAA